MVSVELPGLVPRVGDEGETPQVANGAGPLTVQVRLTCPENPFCPVNVSASVACAPVFRVRAEDAGVKVKSGAKANVAVTDWAAFMVTLQLEGSLPVQAPLHPEKTEPVAAFAPSATEVPCAKLPEQVLPQLMSPGLEATVPEPLPASVTVNVTRGTTLIVCVALLFPGARSGSLPATFIVLETVPTAVGVTTMLIFDSEVDASAPMLQLMIPCACTQLPGVAVAETKFKSVGRVSVKVTPVASLGP